MRLVSLEKGLQRAPWQLPLCEVTKRREPSLSQELGSHQTLNLDLGVLGPRTVRNKFLLFISHLVYCILL